MVGAGVAIAAVPFYIGLLGLDSYGLIGFYATLTSALTILDCGLTPTVTRELARHHDSAASRRAARDLARTLEVVTWGMALVLGLSLYFVAPLLAGTWLRSDALPHHVLENALRLMAIGVAAQWPLSLYQGGMRGLDRQVLLNGVVSAGAIIRATGAVGALIFVGATPSVFFAWQAGAAFVQVLVVAFLFWRGLGGAASARFQLLQLKTVGSFAAGMSLTAGLSFALRQSDKVVLSKLLPLDIFAIYLLGATLAGGLATLSSAVFTAVFPRLASVVKNGAPAAIRHEYQRASEVAGALNASVGGVCVFFALEVIWAWSGNPELASRAQLTAAMLVLGTALNGIAGMPYDLQIAHGWTSLGVFKNLIAVLVLVPVTILLAIHYGAPGAALAWVLLNIGYLAIEVPIVHHYLMRGQSFTWYRDALLLPVLSACIVCTAARVAMPDVSTRTGAIALVILVSVATVAAVAAVTPAVRTWLVAHGRRASAFSG